MNTRDRILSEAEALTRTRGFLGFSYADLSERIGIQKASIHHHFTNKEELGVALIALYRERCLNRMIEIMAKAPSARERLCLYGDLYTDGLKQGLACLCGVLASEVNSLPPAMRSGVQSFFEEHHSWLKNVLQEGIQKAEINKGVSPEKKAQELLAALQGAMFIARLHEQPGVVSQVLSGQLVDLCVLQ